MVAQRIDRLTNQFPLLGITHCTAFHLCSLFPAGKAVLFAAFIAAIASCLFLLCFNITFIPRFCQSKRTKVRFFLPGCFLAFI
jgi:hypothetical protein